VTITSSRTGVATGSTPHVVDKTTVARLQRALAALVKQGNAQNLPDDWEARLQEMHDRAPQRRGPYDAFRGLPSTPRPSLRAPLESGHVPVEAQDAADRDCGAPKRTTAATAKDK